MTTSIPDFNNDDILGWSQYPYRKKTAEVAVPAANNANEDITRGALQRLAAEVPSAINDGFEPHTIEEYYATDDIQLVNPAPYMDGDSGISIHNVNDKVGLDLTEQPSSSKKLPTVGEGESGIALGDAETPSLPGSKSPWPTNFFTAE